MNIYCIFPICPEDKHGSLLSGEFFSSLSLPFPSSQVEQDIKRCRSKTKAILGDDRWIGGFFDDLRRMICSNQQLGVFRVTSAEVARICCNVQAQYTPCHCRYNLHRYLGDSFPSEAPPTNILIYLGSTPPNNSHQPESSCTFWDQLT